MGPWKKFATTNYFFFSFFSELAVLDPPYGLNMAEWDKAAWDVQAFPRILGQVGQVSTNDNMMFICFCSIQQQAAVAIAIETAGWKHPQFVVIYKKNKTSEGSNHFTQTCEFMYFAWKKSRVAAVSNYRSAKYMTDHWQSVITGKQAYICTDDNLPTNPCQKSQHLLNVKCYPPIQH